MPKRLSERQVEDYRTKGYACPVNVMTPGEAREFRRRFEESEQKMGGAIGYPEKLKPHLLFEWADDLVHHPGVLDAVEDVLGADILLFQATIWAKDAHTDAFVLWHQDGTHFRLDPAEQVTAWVALSDSTVDAGCVRVIPGSHQHGQYEHKDYVSPGNMIRRGMGIPPGTFSDDDGDALVLKAGDLSLHNTMTVHASSANRTDDRRIGIGISYIPAHVKPVSGPKSSAMLVRGQDRFQHHLPEPRYLRTDGNAARAAHKLAVDLFSERQMYGARPVLV